jgi:hypothetical protein
MLPSIQLVPTGFGLAAVLSWGTSDFLGGFASRRANAFLLTTIAHGSGLLLMVALEDYLSGRMHVARAAALGSAFCFAAACCR